MIQRIIVLKQWTACLEPWKHANFSLFKTGKEDQEMRHYQTEVQLFLKGLEEKDNAAQSFNDLSLNLPESNTSISNALWAFKDN